MNQICLPLPGTAYVRLYSLWSGEENHSIVFILKSGTKFLILFLGTNIYIYIIFFCQQIIIFSQCTHFMPPVYSESNNQSHPLTWTVTKEYFSKDLVEVIRLGKYLKIYEKLEGTTCLWKFASTMSGNQSRVLFQLNFVTELIDHKVINLPTKYFRWC